jgi:transposase
MAKQLSSEEKSAIIAYFDSGKSIQELAEKYGKTPSTIYRVIQRYNNRGCFERPRQLGRPKICTMRTRKFILAKIRKDPKLGSRKLKVLLQKSLGILISCRTIRRFLVSVGLHARISCSKPLLTDRHHITRFEHAKYWLFHPITYWETVIFSDETKINLFGSDGRSYVRRINGTRVDLKHLTPTVKYGGGSIMIWGCFSANGVGRIYIIEGKMDSIKYIEILNTCLESSAHKMGLTDYTFQQDNDPKHCSKLTKEYLASKRINVMSWPSQSPDMNPIEHLWAYLKRQIRQKKPKNIEELKRITREEWEQISPDFCKKLVLSMPQRARELYEAKGGHTSF